MFRVIVLKQKDTGARTQDKGLDVGHWKLDIGQKYVSQ